MTLHSGHAEVALPSRSGHAPLRRSASGFRHRRTPLRQFGAVNEGRQIHIQPMDSPGQRIGRDGGAHIIS